MHTSKSHNIFDASVRQDKGTPWRSDTALNQPADDSAPSPVRPKHHGSQKRYLREVSGCIRPETFAELERMRDQWSKEQGKKERLSRSEVVGTLITRGVRGNVDMQYGSLLEPVIKKIIISELQRFGNLAVQGYYSAEQSRILVIQLLRLILGKDIEELPQLLADIQQESWANMEPHIKEIQHLTMYGSNKAEIYPKPSEN